MVKSFLRKKSKQKKAETRGETTSFPDNMIWAHGPSSIWRQMPQTPEFCELNEFSALILKKTNEQTNNPVATYNEKV